jgi:hypothetical protein
MDSEFGALIDEPAATRRRSKVTPYMPYSDAASEAVGASSADAAVDELIVEQERMSPFQQRLLLLQDAFYEDNLAALDASSKNGFECFFRYNVEARMPLLGAESTGNVVATWVRGSECLTLRFNSRYDFHFALTTQADGRVQRHWGMGHVLTFAANFPEAQRLLSERQA